MDITLTVAVATTSTKRFAACVKALAAHTGGTVGFVGIGQGSKILVKDLPEELTPRALKNFKAGHAPSEIHEALVDLATAQHPELDDEAHVILFLADTVHVDDEGYNVKVAHAFADDPSLDEATLVGLSRQEALAVRRSALALPEDERKSVTLAIEATAAS